jgi:hypothetical protein
MGGAFFETFVIAEILKSYANQGREAPLYYYHFNALSTIANIERGPGGVVCMYKELTALTAGDRIIPVSWL